MLDKCVVSCTVEDCIHAAFRRGLIIDLLA